MVVLQSALMLHQWLIVGVLYEILGFVGSYDLGKCVRLMLMCFYNFVVLKMKGDYCGRDVVVVVRWVLDFHCFVKYHTQLVL